MTESAATDIIRFYPQTPIAFNSGFSVSSSPVSYSNFDSQPLQSTTRCTTVSDVESPLTSAALKSPSLISPNNGDGDLSSIKFQTCGSTFYGKIEKFPVAFDSPNLNSGLILLKYNCSKGGNAALHSSSKRQYTSGASLFSQNTSPQEAPLNENSRNIQSLINQKEKELNASKESMDPIYETYIRYLHQEQYKDEDDEEGNNQEDSERSNFLGINDNSFQPNSSNKPNHTKGLNTFINVTSDLNNQDNIEIKENEGQMVEKRNTGINDRELDAQEDDDTKIRRSSPLTRLKTKAKSFLRQMSKHRDNELKPVGNTINLREDLKRRFPTVSIRHEQFHCNHSGYMSDLDNAYDNKGEKAKEEIPLEIQHKWSRWGLKRGNSLSVRNTTSNNKFNLLSAGIESSDEGKSIKDLFESPGFQERLNEGTINGRKSYDNENEFDTGDENETYQISYKYTKPPYRQTQNHQSYFRNTFDFKKSMNSVSNLNSSRKDRSSSLRLFLGKLGTPRENYS